MKSIILAGGFGSRLEEITKIIPKPLVKLKNIPILIHILKIFVKHNKKDFIIALGYKGEKIVEYFIKRKITRVIKKKLIKGFSIKYKILGSKCNITFLETGLKTMTGGRVKKAANLVKEENFMMTYGDGLSNVNLNKLVKQHIKLKKLVTVTAVNPPARFGELKIKGKQVVSFSEKKSIKESWINGGFFVMNKKFTKFIKGGNTILERDPLEKAARIGQLNSYKHSGFWQCMDTKRDKDNLEKILNKKIV